MLIIAEAGVNHNGSKQRAMQLIDAAVEAKADIVKFQTFRAERLVTKSALKAEYQTKNTKGDDQLSMLKSLELSPDEFVELSSYCETKGIEFLSTAFDTESLDFLVENTSLRRLKIPSGELTNAPFVLQHARKGLPLIISTGMATLSEVEQALKVLAFGLIKDADELPSAEQLDQVFSLPDARQAIEDNVTVLHCTTEYPAPFDSVNLNAMLTMGDAFNVAFGYSDHTKGIAVPIAAASLGASIIEKHFTLDRQLPGPDHKASIEPNELKLMVESIHQCQQALGNGVKTPSKQELANRTAARKSLVALMPIQRGEAFTKENLTVKRPGNGVSPALYWDYLGKLAGRDYAKDDLIE